MMELPRTKRLPNKMRLYLSFHDEFLSLKDDAALYGGSAYNIDAISQYRTKMR